MAGGLYILITILLGFAAVNTGNNLLFLVVSGLLAFMSVTGYVGMANLQRLSVELIPPSELYAGQPASFMLRIGNRKRRLPSFLLSLSCQGGKAVLGHLPAGTTVDLPLELTLPERGWTRVTSAQVSSPFPVGFFIRSWRLTVDRQLLVYPQLVPCVESGGGRQGSPVAGGRHDERSSSGEMERIVEYSGREPLRQIHWKLSARSDELKVKQYRSATAEPLTIELDDLPGRLEERISCAAWLVHHWTPERPVGLRLGEQRVPSQAGLRQMHHLLGLLAVYAKSAS